MKNKKTIGKIKLTTTDIKKKAKSFTKKVTSVADTLKKQWEKEQPQRDKFKIFAKKALKNGIKISDDVFETIQKDINEIKSEKSQK